MSGHPRGAGRGSDGPFSAAHGTSPDLPDVLEASARIAPCIHRTPVLTCETLNGIAGAEIFFKCENFQKIGAFKIRGAANAIFSLSGDEAARGVATHSSGNHAQAVAFACRARGIGARIVMPENSSRVKVDAVRGYGADIVFCGLRQKDREETLRRVLAETGSVLIHPYDDFRVIAGQATAALELLEQAGGVAGACEPGGVKKNTFVSDCEKLGVNSLRRVNVKPFGDRETTETPPLDFVLAPVGGGGLLSGTSIAVKNLSPTTVVIGAEPQYADDAFRSLRDGVLYPQSPGTTIADGLRTGLSERTFSIIRRHVAAVVTVSEESIVAAMRTIWERMKILVEPSAAVPFAAILEEKLDVRGKRVGMILSGGNVDLDALPW
jgi:threonine dehydratase